MFTGLIHNVGRIDSVEVLPEGKRLWISCAFSWSELSLGASLSVNGICLTVEKRRFWPRAFCVTAVHETLERTHLKSWKRGDLVNLEASLKASSFMGGHWVSGHVDGVGKVTQIAPHLKIQFPSDLRAFFPVKGSVTIDGVSLTIARVSAQDLELALIPETLSRTTLGFLRCGDSVNLEVDLLARYLLNALELGFVPSK
jgi:riboflavin synthase